MFLLKRSIELNSGARYEKSKPANAVKDKLHGGCYIQVALRIAGVTFAKQFGINVYVYLLVAAVVFGSSK
jgi:hypothetical protein